MVIAPMVLAALEYTKKPRPCYKIEFKVMKSKGHLYSVRAIGALFSLNHIL